MLGKQEQAHKDFHIPLMDDEFVEDVEEQPGQSRQYKDVLFLVLFGLNLLCTVSLALLYGVVALSSSGNEVIKVTDSGKEYDQTAEFTPSVEILFGMVTVLAAAVVATSIWILTLSRIASFVLNAILISLIMVPIICGMVLFFMGYFAFGFALLLLSVCLLVLSLFIRPRMDFAAVNLKVACSAVLQMPSVFGYALLAVGIQVLYSILWGIAAVGYATSNTEVTIHAHGLNYNLDECTTYVYAASLTIPGYDTLTCAGGSCRACVCDGTYISGHACTSPKLYGWAYFWLLLSLFWTSAVIANVVHCTVSAAVAKWWQIGYPSAAAVQLGFERATTTSLGSICLASLLVAVVRTTRSAVHFASKQLSAVQSTGLLRTLQLCFTRVLVMLLTALDRLVVYFNRYALCFVAMYRHDFLTASKAATNLFAQKGFTALLNDDIIDVVLNIGHVIIGIITMCVGYVYGRLSGVGHAYTVLLTVFGFAAGYLVSIVALSTISSAVATVYVCYVDNPHALQVSHPEMYVPLSEAWMRISPSRAEGHKGAEGSVAPGLSAAGAATAGTRPETPASTSSAGSAGTRIRGSFGSSDGADAPAGPRGHFEVATGGAAEGSNAFAAGFAFIAALFPSASSEGDQGGIGRRMDTALTGKSDTSAGTTLRGGYANLSQTEGPDAVPPAQRWGPPQQNPTLGGAWPAAHKAPSQGQFTSAQAHHWGPPSTVGSAPVKGPVQHRLQRQGSGEMFTQALTAINSLTSRLSDSVFGPGAGAGAGASQGADGRAYAQGRSDGAGASLMSVQLEESFSV